MIYLICHVILPYHFIDGPFMGGSSLRYVILLISLVTKSTVTVEMFLICHVTSREHIFKRLCDFTRGSTLTGVTTLTYMVTIALF